MGETGREVVTLHPQYLWAGAMLSHANDFVLQISESVSSFAPIYSEVTLNQVHQWKDQWDELPMYAVEANGRLTLFNYLGRPIGAI